MVARRHRHFRTLLAASDARRDGCHSNAMLSSHCATPQGKLGSPHR